MSQTSNAAAVGQAINQFLRDCKQIPHPTPIMGSPRVQGWIAGFADAHSEDAEDAELYVREFYVTAMDGTSMGQAFGLDMAISKQRIAKDGPSLGYNTIYFEFFEKGRSEHKASDISETTLFELLGKK